MLIGGGAVGMVLSLEDDWICAPLPTAGASPVCVHIVVLIVYAVHAVRWCGVLKLWCSC